MKDFFKGNPRLETERLILRKIKYSDLEAIFAYASDPDVTRFLLWDTHKSLADTEHFLRFTMGRYENGDAGEWGVVLKDSKKLVGTIGFPWYDVKNRRAEIGYVLSKDCWGKGIMPEAAARVLKFAFEEMGEASTKVQGFRGINRIECCHFLPNEKSGRVMQKCGMRFEGTARQKMFAKGQFWDVQQYAILKEEWEKQHL